MASYADPAPVATFAGQNVWTAASDGQLEIVRVMIDSGAHRADEGDAQGDGHLSKRDREGGRACELCCCCCARTIDRGGRRVRSRARAPCKVLSVWCEGAGLFCCSL